MGDIEHSAVNLHYAVLRADLATLRAIVDERDRLYAAQFAASKGAVDLALVAQRDQTAAAFVSAEKAIAKAEQATDKHFEAVNEFRASLADQQALLITRTEAGARFDALEKAVEVNGAGLVELRLALTRTMTLDAYNIRHEELQRAIQAVERTITADKAAQAGHKEAGLDIRTLISFAIGAILFLVAIIGFWIDFTR